MARGNQGARGTSLRRGLYLGLLAFALALFFAFPSQVAVAGWNPLYSLPVLIIIVLLGVVFDIIGVSAARADRAPINALATRRIPGSQQALYLARHAESVSAFCSDVVGDIAGTVAGGAALGITVRLLALGGPGTEVAGAVSLALVAALTVGGKAAGKGVALNHSTSVLMAVGKAIYGIERVTRVRILPRVRGRNREGR